MKCTWPVTLKLSTVSSSGNPVSMSISLMMFCKSKALAGLAFLNKDVFLKGKFQGHILH